MTVFTRDFVAQTDLLGEWFDRHAGRRVDRETFVSLGRMLDEKIREAVAKACVNERGQCRHCQGTETHHPDGWPYYGREKTPRERATKE